MTWFLAVLVVASLGVVALLASGRIGGSLPEVRDDRPEVDLPEGRLAAADLRGVRLPLAVRGYRMEEVDDLLARLADQLDEHPLDPPQNPPRDPGPPDRGDPSFD